MRRRTKTRAFSDIGKILSRERGRRHSALSPPELGLARVPALSSGCRSRMNPTSAGGEGNSMHRCTRSGEGALHQGPLTHSNSPSHHCALSHPNSGLPEFGTRSGRSRVNPTSAGRGHERRQRRRGSSVPLFSVVLHEGEDRKTLALPRFVLPARCIFLVVYNGRGGSSERSLVHSREPPARRKKAQPGCSPAPRLGLALPA
jgi:hypothetical protein